VHEVPVTEGLRPGGTVVFNGEGPPAELAGLLVRCVPATRLASEQGSSFANVVMLGAVAAVLGEPKLETVQEAAVRLLGRKLGAEAIRAAVQKGHAWLS
jgi:Pyruvate/2-oxoacid:ferredoxin oxidoreductase gamma subunit